MPFGEYEDFADCVAKNKGKVDDPEAYCAVIKRKIEGDTHRKIGFDSFTLEAKIIFEDNKILTMPAVIASEIVHQYDDGWAYKPAEELEKMAETANRIGSVPVKILSHPDADTNFLLLKASDVYGKATNFPYVKNLTDPKTQRPCRKGVRADISWFKDLTPPEVIEQIKQATLRDNSIGFTFEREDTQGEFDGVKHDYIQRNIFLNHVAAPIQAGRCPGPICGIGFDSSVPNFGMDDAKLKMCPVCLRIKEVGFETAGKRLYMQYGPDVLEVIEGHELPSVGDEYADPENKKYPIDCGHVMAAWSYINMPRNQAGYTPEKLALMKGRIKTAMKRCGHTVADEQTEDTLDEDFNKAFKELSSKLP
jgi:hypothetical protein